MNPIENLMDVLMILPQKNEKCYPKFLNSLKWLTDTAEFVRKIKQITTMEWSPLLLSRNISTLLWLFLCWVLHIFPKYFNYVAESSAYFCKNNVSRIITQESLKTVVEPWGYFQFGKYEFQRRPSGNGLQYGKQHYVSVSEFGGQQWNSERAVQRLRTEWNDYK